MWKIFAFTIALASLCEARAEAAVYTFQLATQAQNTSNTQSDFFIPLAAPSALDQAISISSILTVPNGAVVTAFEEFTSQIIGGVALGGYNIITNHIYTGNSGNLLNGSFNLGANADRLEIGQGLGTIGIDGLLSITVTIPDELQPGIAVSVPEPSTWAMLLIGFIGIGFASRISPRALRRSFLTPEKITDQTSPS